MLHYQILVFATHRGMLKSHTEIIYLKYQEQQIMKYLKYLVDLILH